MNRAIGDKRREIEKEVSGDGASAEDDGDWERK